MAKAVSVLSSQLDRPAYHQAVRMRGYNGPITVFQAVSIADAARLLKRVCPDMDKAAHANLSAAHATEASLQKNEWSRLLHEAAQATFGRPFLFSDYRISAIGREEFSDEYKDQIRFAAHASAHHNQLARAHARAAR